MAQTLEHLLSLEFKPEYSQEKKKLQTTQSQFSEEEAVDINELFSKISIKLCKGQKGKSVDKHIWGEFGLVEEPRGSRKAEPHLF